VAQLPVDIGLWRGVHRSDEGVEIVLGARRHLVVAAPSATDHRDIQVEGVRCQFRMGDGHRPTRATHGQCQAFPAVTARIAAEPTGPGEIQTLLDCRGRG